MPLNRVKGFVGPSYTLRTSTLDCARTINLYAEVDETGNGKDGNVACLIGTPGKRLLGTVGSGPIRGIYAASNDTYYVASGGSLYRVESDISSVTRLGSISGTSGRAVFADNGTTLCVVAGGVGYFHTLGSSTITQISDPDFYGANTVAFLDGYFIFNRPNTGQFYITSLYGTDFDALDFATAEANPDRLIGVVANNRELWMFGTRTIELFYNSGDVNFPFDRTGGAVIEKGCSNYSTIAKLNNSLFWLGSDEQGSGIVWMASNYTPQRISNHAVEFAIQGYDVSGATAYTYEQEGHFFYCLNFPEADTTWCYDLTTQMWHERCYTDPNTGEQQRDLADCYGFLDGNRVVGDYRNGNIYQLDLDWYRDGADSIKRVRTSPHVANNLEETFFHTFQVDAEVGVGLDGIAIGSEADVQTGENPQAILSWSNDGGRTFGSEQWRSIGPIGQYRTRITWRQLGRSRDRVWRLTITDPVRVRLIQAYFDATGGRY